jgi:hypothetical protein
MVDEWTCNCSACRIVIREAKTRLKQRYGRFDRETVEMEIRGLYTTRLDLKSQEREYAKLLKETECLKTEVINLNVEAGREAEGVVPKTLEPDPDANDQNTKTLYERLKSNDHKTIPFEPFTESQVQYVVDFKALVDLYMKEQEARVEELYKKLNRSEVRLADYILEQTEDAEAKQESDSRYHESNMQVIQKRWEVDRLQGAKYWTENENKRLKGLSQNLERELVEMKDAAKVDSQAEKIAALENKLAEAEKARDEAVGEKDRISTEKEKTIQKLTARVEELETDSNEISAFFMDKFRDKKRPRTEE